jgi:hypothetical protein
VILDIDNNLNKVNVKDKAKGTISDVNTRRFKRDVSLYNTFITLKLALALIESINVFSL